jgi:hypothetical protein
MKRVIYALLILVGLQLASCGKYEEGPGFSLRSKTGRLAGEWTIEKMTVDGEDFTAFVAAFITNTEFTKDGDYILTGTDFFSGTPITEKSKWEFSDDNSKIVLTDADGSKSSMEILRLTNSELWVKETSDGEVTEIHYKAK